MLLFIKLGFFDILDILIVAFFFLSDLSFGEGDGSD